MKVSDVDSLVLRQEPAADALLDKRIQGIDETDDLPVAVHLVSVAPVPARGTADPDLTPRRGRCPATSKESQEQITLG
jgi:hypothetical protein